ncbi:thiolase family protein [Thiothrix subterranea]|uniref:Thiolase family protein n=1 Tax=Thiothrix subterranea TaxID=2735563 RepID=A0AA51R5T7_9GAMM|nr:thiolase family protein [Thiothrix subterranea]MDQ5766993.1 thiolase family protein [Thiothrix subterranea]WML88145.1 thiolase family protein [Thiothrix subterranea]
MKSVVIAGYARTPFTPAHKGAFAKVRPDDLATAAIRGLLAQTDLDPHAIEDLILGCAFPEGEQGFNMARLVALMAELPLGIGGVTVNRFCGSSMQAIHQAAGAIQMNAGDVFICAGVESMTRIPMTGFNPSPNPALYAKLPAAYISMGQTAENLAKRYGISRAEQETFAVASQQKAAAAQAAGHFNAEIIPVGAVTQDGCIRPDTTAATLTGLKLAFDEHGTVTAGTASPLTDGASATLVCSETFARAHGLPLLARIHSIAISGCAPDIMGIGPVLATQKALQRAGLTLADLDIIELNEAFAAQAIACIRDLGLDESKLNLDGGAIALGHPLGASGARITGKAAALLQREGKQFALATQCIGGGQGIATILEAVS